ncbi:MAG: PD-(D/E)XK nuclease family protein, partial [Arcanobacterium sp.]|nr:PD-(D/E)XK nuclease family protein [Arcanobacterium sp.]
MNEANEDAAQLLWDQSQCMVFEACVPPCSLSVIGGPGSGKTTVLEECVRRILSADPERTIAVLTPDRRAAGKLRNSLSTQLGGRGENLTVKSIAAFSFAIVSHFAQAHGQREPELMAGPDQDSLLRDIFSLAEAGYLPELDARALARLGISQQASEFPAFRAEIRDLITRAAELDLTATELSQLAQQYHREAWAFGARVMERYEAALATQASAANTSPDRIDHARVITRAAAALQAWGGPLQKPAGDRSAVVGFSSAEENAPHWDFVFVDDVHNATLAVRSLLRALQMNGTNVVTFGNPDQGVQSYRGGIFQLPVVLTKSARAGGIGARELPLLGSYRAREAIASVIAGITEGIPTAGVSQHRRSAPEAGAPTHDQEPPIQAKEASAAVLEQRDYGAHTPIRAEQSQSHTEHVAALSFPNESEELAYIAHTARELHLLRGVPYSEIVVITRSRALHAALRAGLVRHGVPVRAENLNTPLREQPAVAALLACVQLAIADFSTLRDSELSEMLTEVLVGKLGSLDPLSLRILGRRVVSALSAAGSAVTLYEAWASFVHDPQAAPFAEFPELAPLANALRAGRSAHSRRETAAQVLWGMWKALDVAEVWRERALGTGILAEQANADLDAVIQLFRVAQRLEERDIRAASIERLLEHLASQDLPEDSVARAGSVADAVTLATPASTVGHEWGHVIISGLNEGVWPNTRLRNPLTQVPELVSVVVEALVNGDHTTQPTQLRREVVADELRMLLQAVSRARESVIFTCVHSEDTQPSRFLRWLAQREGNPTQLRHAPRTVRVLGATALVGELRQALHYGTAPVRERAHELLNVLAMHDVRGADTQWWFDQLAVPDADPSHGADTVVAVSPSAVDSMLTCPLRGFLDGIGGEDTDRFASANVGTLIHAIAEQFPHGSAAEMLAQLDARWGELGLAPGSMSEQREYQAARKMLETFASYIKQAPPGVLVEKRAYGEIDGITVHARLDRLEFDPDHPTRLVVADIKTGKQAPTKSEVAEHPQMLLYQWLVDRQGVALREVDETGKPLPLTADERIVQEAIQRGEQLHSLGAQLIYVRREPKKQLPVYQQSEAG